MIWITLLSACVTLDGFVHNPRHCSVVDPDACDPDSWDTVCVPCDEPYRWDLDYPYFPDQLGPGQTIRAPEVVERLTIPTEDGLGELDAYWVPSHGEAGARANTTILYHHGNYAGIEHYIYRARVLHELGYNVLIWDYRGYGKSLPDTAPSATEFLADARLLREVVDTYAPDPDRVVVYGYSLGGVPAMEAALHRRPCATVLEAPFTSTRSIARSNAAVDLPETYLSAGGFDNLRKAASHEAPLFVMVGELDHLFPPDEVERIHDAAPGPKRLWVLPGVRHGISDIGVVEAGVPAYDDALASFFADLAPACLTP